MEIETINLLGLKIDKKLTQMLEREYANKYLAVPVKHEGEHLWVAMSNPHDKATIADLNTLTRKFIVPMLANTTEIRHCISQAYDDNPVSNIASQFLVEERLWGMDLQNILITEKTENFAEVFSAPVVRLIDTVLEGAVLNRASDIHLEPYKHHLRVRFRIDGQLTMDNLLDLNLVSTVMSRLKIMGNMDIAEKRIPQDGHFSLTVFGERIDFRLSTLPTIYGEKAAIRLLYGHSTRRKKHELGFLPEDLEKLTALFHQPYGAIFMTGPTGSGKSTTLNSFLEELDSTELNIVTVEDPVENPLLGVNHVSIDTQKGLTFNQALKYILRQDPDIIMIGEIRDKETAQIATQAAITGHLVLSTLHTNDAAGVIERLADMGIEPYLVASSLNGIISQRLVRKICEKCITETELSPQHSQFLKIDASTTVYKGIGCLHCGNTGFRGRVAIYEYIIMNEELRRQMGTNPNDFAITVRSQKGLRKNAIQSLLAGITTAKEIVKVLSRDME